MERNVMRKVFFGSFRKHHEKLPLEPLEAQILDIILLHPEYHPLLSQPDVYQEKDFSDTNPFLHLSLHLAIREQINTNRPAGIQTVFQHLSQKLHDRHAAEHKMMECLTDILSRAQQTGTMPDEKDYLEYLQRIT